MVTSAHTVRTPQRLEVRLPGRVTAVGKATAAALGAVGYTVDFVPRETDAAGILEKFPTGMGRMVIPGSALSKPDLPEGSRKLGWRAGVFPVYAMEATQEPAELAARWRAGRFAAVVVTAGSTVRVIDERLEWPRETQVLAIRQPTVKVLNELGVVASVSPSPEMEVITRATVELVEKGNTWPNTRVDYAPPPS